MFLKFLGINMTRGKLTISSDLVCEASPFALGDRVLEYLLGLLRVFDNTGDDATVGKLHLESAHRRAFGNGKEIAGIGETAV